MKGKVFPESLSISYLSKNKMQWIHDKCSVKSQEEFFNPTTILHAFRSRAGKILANAAMQVQALQSEGKTANQAFESCSVDLCKASWAHAWYVSMSCFYNAIRNIKDNSLKSPLLALFNLLGLSHFEENATELLETGYFSSEHMKMIRNGARKCLSLIRPNAIALVDSWDFTDKYLNSALGRYDGNVYEALYESAKKSSRNRYDVAPGIKENLLPRFKSNL